MARAGSFPGRVHGRSAAGGMPPVSPGAAACSITGACPGHGRTPWTPTTFRWPRLKGDRIVSGFGYWPLWGIVTSVAEGCPLFRSWAPILGSSIQCSQVECKFGSANWTSLGSPWKPRYVSRIRTDPGVDRDPSHAERVSLLLHRISGPVASLEAMDEAGGPVAAAFAVHGIVGPQRRPSLVMETCNPILY